jgi:hypothetical protein
MHKAQRQCRSTNGKAGTASLSNQVLVAKDFGIQVTGGSRKLANAQVKARRQQKINK